MAAVTICSDFGAPKNKVWHCFHCFPIHLPWRTEPDAMILVFWMLSFKTTFSLSSFTFIKRLFSSSSLSAIRVVSSAYLRWLNQLCVYIYPISLGLFSHPFPLHQFHPSKSLHTLSWASCALKQVSTIYFRHGSGYIGNPLQHSCLENPVERGVWSATVHGVPKSQTRLKRPAQHSTARNIYVNPNLPTYFIFPFLPTPPCVHMSILYMCLSVSALGIGASVPFS